MAFDLSKPLSMIVQDQSIIIQQAPYVDHGCYIQIVHDGITLYKIPYGGGEPIRISGHHTIMGAIEKANTLT